MTRRSRVQISIVFFFCIFFCLQVVNFHAFTFNLGLAMHGLLCYNWYPVNKKKSEYFFDFMSVLKSWSPFSYLSLEGQFSQQTKNTATAYKTFVAIQHYSQITWFQEYARKWISCACISLKSKNRSIIKFYSGREIWRLGRILSICFLMLPITLCGQCRINEYRNKYRKRCFSSHCHFLDSKIYIFDVEITGSHIQWIISSKIRNKIFNICRLYFSVRLQARTLLAVFLWCLF